MDKRIRQKKNKIVLRLKRELDRREKREKHLDFLEAKKQRKEDGRNNDFQYFNIHKNLPTRNQKCFCGSEKKYKLCCLSKVREHIREGSVSFVSDNFNVK